MAQSSSWSPSWSSYRAVDGVFVLLNKGNGQKGGVLSFPKSLYRTDNYVHRDNGEGAKNT